MWKDKTEAWSPDLGLIPHFRIDAKKGVNAPGVDRHIELPIGNKTNIVSIMLTKGWL